MANQYVNKVVYAGDTLVDLTSDTVDTSRVLSGATFHLPSGQKTTGAMINVGKQQGTITKPQQSITISKGYHDGTGSISINQTVDSATIKPGTVILGIPGTFTNDANAAATDILVGQTAYVKGSKVTGSLQVSTVYTGSAAPNDSLGIDGDIYIIV